MLLSVLQKMVLIVDEQLEVVTQHEFLKELYNQCNDGDTINQSLTFRITCAAHCLGLKLLWFNTTSVLLHGNNYQVGLGSHKLQIFLGNHLDPKHWCTMQAMTCQYSTSMQDRTVKRNHCHDLVIYNLACEDCDLALVSPDGYM